MEYLCLCAMSNNRARCRLDNDMIDSDLNIVRYRGVRRSTEQSEFHGQDELEQWERGWQL
jgi:hypothetical protein